VRERTGLFIVVLWVIALLQPFYAMSFIHGMFGKGGALKHERRTVEFSYQRPAFGSGFNEEHAYNHRLKYRKDESGYVSEGFFGQRGSYLIRKEVPAGVLGDYVRHKFVLYCSTRTMDPGNVEWGAVSRALSFRDKAAIVHDAGGDPAFAEACRPHPVEGAADGVRVIRFDVNTIELEVDLPYRKFLVYNDSYHTGWRAFIDGKRVKLYQANIAFKGVWVEKGRHRVLFRFGTAMGRLSAFGFTAFYLIWAVIVAMAFLRAFRPREAYV
jgi:hypothetical protein